MSAGPGEDAERFAAAVELGRSPGLNGSAHARELEIVAMLRSRGDAFAPDPRAKAQAKARLMAVLAGQHDTNSLADITERDNLARRDDRESQHATPGHTGRGREVHRSGRDHTGRTTRVDGAGAVTEALRLVPSSDRPDARPGSRSDAEPAEAVTEPTSAGRVAAEVAADGVVTSLSRRRRPGQQSTRSGARHSMPTRPGERGRVALMRLTEQGPARQLLLNASAALVLAIAMTGAGAMLSRNAIPGDALYGVKRVAETAGLALTFDDAAQAGRHFELAGTRLDEVERLVRSEPEKAAAQPELVVDGLREFDESTGEGARMLLATDEAGGADALVKLRDWAATQSVRLTELRPDLPPSADADPAIELLGRLVGRTEGFVDSCGNAAPDSVDDLGPQPAQVTCPGWIVGGFEPWPDPSVAGGTEQPRSPASPGASLDPTTSGSPDAGPRSSTGTRPSTGTGSRGAPTGRSGTGSEPDPATSQPGVPPASQPDPGAGTVEEPPAAPPSNTTAPEPPAAGTDTGSDDGGLLPPIELPLPLGLPGISIG